MWLTTALDQTIYVARPHRVRVITIIATLVLCLLTAIGWFLLPEEIRVLFTLSQRLTLLGVLALLIVGMVALASSYVRADPTAFGSATVYGFMLCRGGASTRSSSARRPLGSAAGQPEDGRPFEADLDAEKRQLMGIQAVDGSLAKAAVNELRVRHRRFLKATN